jgi:hypothetical protein
MAAPTRLPLRGANGAPNFDGTSIHLNRFFTDIDLIYDLAGVNPNADERIRQCKYYLDNDTFMLWDGVAIPPAGFTWDNFKAAIRLLYPGCEGGRLYSIRDLERFVSDADARGVYTRGDLGEYFREFMRIAGHLTAQGRIEQGELNRLYIQGFGQTTRAKIEQRLQITQPDHHPEDPYNMNDVQIAATFLLSHTSPTLPGTTFSTPTIPGVFAANARVNPAASPQGQQQVKREMWDMDSFMSNIGKVIADSMAQHAGAYRPPYQPMNNPAGAGPRPVGCHFCGGFSCRIATCPVVEDYWRAGKCIRNEQGRVCLPSGRFIPGHIQGANLKERFDNFLAANPIIPVLTVSTMMFESVESFITEEDSDAGSDIELLDGDLEVLHRVLASELAKKGKKPAPKLKPVVEIRTAHPAPRPASNRPVAPTPPKAPEPPPKPTKPDAQYRFQSPLENLAVTQRVLDKALDVPITLSQRELLAVSPDLRRKLKDLTTGRRIATTQAEVLISEAYFEREDEERAAFPTYATALVVAEDSLPLRAFAGTLDGRTSAECVIDNGSSIVAVRRDIWEKLGTPVCADSILNMQSSNSSLAATTGLLRDFPLTIGPATFYLQIQVADTLPCEVLLGRPFFSLTRAVTVDHEDGSMNLELNDPNTGQKLRVPTHEKKNLRRSDF